MTATWKIFAMSKRVNMQLKTASISFSERFWKERHTRKISTSTIYGGKGDKEQIPSCAGRDSRGSYATRGYQMHLGGFEGH